MQSGSVCANDDALILIFCNNPFPKIKPFLEECPGLCNNCFGNNLKYNFNKPYPSIIPR